MRGKFPFIMTLSFALLGSMAEIFAQCTNASFGSVTNVGAGFGPLSVAVGDFNGDGRSDLAVANYFSDNVTILLGDGSGRFSEAAGSPAGAGTRAVSVAVGDFNGDGRPDLAVANYFSDSVTILLGDGSGGFSEAAGSPVGARYGPRSVAVGDFNGDGKPDLAVANYASHNVTILLGDGIGGFNQPAGSPVGAWPGPFSVAVGDFNLDGKTDLAVANYLFDSVTILLGDGSGGFSQSANSPVGAGSGAASVAVGDLNGDGKPDLAVANYNSDNVTVLLGDGNGGFTQPPGSPTAAGLGSVAVAAGDFNGDGRPDLAVANWFSDSVTILLGDGSGGFSQPGGWLVVGVGSQPGYVAIADLNGDGRPDVAVANARSGKVSVLLNTCTANRPPVARATAAPAIGH